MVCTISFVNSNGWSHTERTILVSPITVYDLSWIETQDCCCVGYYGNSLQMYRAHGAVIGWHCWHAARHMAHDATDATGLNPAHPSELVSTSNWYKPVLPTDKFSTIWNIHRVTLSQWLNLVFHREILTSPCQIFTPSKFFDLRSPAGPRASLWKGSNFTFPPLNFNPILCEIFTPSKFFDLGSPLPVEVIEFSFPPVNFNPAREISTPKMFRFTLAGWWDCDW